MVSDASIRYFEAQFQRQVSAGDLHLNPFEQAALPYLRGHVLDFGCGLGNLAIAAARNGCSVVAVDGSHTAIQHVRQVAQAEGLPIVAAEADLRRYELVEAFDTVVSIGLLMFFDCPTAFRQLSGLQEHVRPGGTAIVNVLIEGTSYMDMFDPSCHCLFARDELQKRFSDWKIVSAEYQSFPAPGDQVKSFLTLVAQKPASADTDVGCA